MKSHLRWVAPGIIFLASALILSIFFRQQIQENLAVPLLKAWYWLQMMDRNLIWGVFIAILYILIIITLPPLPTSARSFLTSGNLQDKYLHQTTHILGQEAEGRVTFWLNEIFCLKRDHFRTRFSVVEIRRLILETIAFRQHCSLHEAELWLEDKSNRVPSVVRSLLRVKPQPLPHQGAGSLFWLWRRLKSWIRPFSVQSKETDEDMLETIIEFLEEQQEIVHEHSNI